MKERQQEKKILYFESVWNDAMSHGTLKFQIEFWALKPTSTKEIQQYMQQFVESWDWQVLGGGGGKANKIFLQEK